MYPLWINADADGLYFGSKPTQWTSGDHWSNSLEQFAGLYYKQISNYLVNVAPVFDKI